MVHQYKLNGYNIVLDSCSGSIHVVDDVAYDIIAMYQDNSPEEIVKAVSEKYAGRQDVKEKDILDCIEDIKALMLYNPIISFTMRSQPLMAPTSTSRLNANSPTYVQTAVTTDAPVSTAGGLDEMAEKIMQDKAITTPCKQPPA